MSLEKEIEEIKQNQEIIKKQLEEIKNIINKNTNSSLLTNQVNYYNEDNDTDPLLDSAVTFVIENGIASTSIIQRNFRLGYARAGRILDQMESLGVVSGYRGSKPRDILVTLEQWKDIKKNNIK